MLSNDRHHKRIISVAFHDALTGLPNKAHLQQVLDEALGQSFQTSKAIVMIHGHNINMINSTYGLDVGDRVMTELATRLETFAIGGRQLYRFADDGFVLFVENYRSKDELCSLAEDILRDIGSSLDSFVRPIRFESAWSNSNLSYRPLMCYAEPPWLSIILNGINMEQSLPSSMKKWKKT